MRNGESSNTPLELHDPQPGLLYTLEGVIHLTGASRRNILVYCKSGLVQPKQPTDSEPMQFDEETIYLIRRIEQLRAERGINLEGIRMILELWGEVQRLQNEIRFLRS